MAKKKKSRSNRGNKKVNFHNILQHYKRGEYQQTLNLIRKSSIPPQYAGQAKQLKVVSSNQLALECFKNLDFKKGIPLLEPNLRLTGKPDFPLPIDQTKILLGVSYLYTNEFVKASEHLAFTKDSTDPNIQSFYFYYILAELHQQKLIGEAAQDVFQTLPENRQQYLMAVFYLQQNDLNNFKKVIEHLKGSTEEETSNLVALQNIFSIKSASTEYKPQHLKAIYRLYNNLFIEDFEKDFLSQDKKIDAYLKEQNAQIQGQDLEQQIIRLFEEQQLIDDNYFDNLLTTIPKRYVPILGHIVYNQIALLYNNHADIEKIQQQAIKFKNHLFQIPESLSLFLSLYSREDDLSIHPSKTFNILDIYLSNFGATLSKRYLNTLSWQIFDFLLATGEEMGALSINKKIVKYIEQYPDLIGLKWWSLLVGTALKKQSLINTNQLDIFSHATTQDNKEPLISNLNGFISVHRPPEMPELSFLADLFYNNVTTPIGIQKKEYKQHLLNLVSVMKKATQHAPPHPKATVTLDIIKIIGAEIYRAITKVQIDFSKAEIQNFTQFYEKILIHFGENHKNSVYFNHLQIFKYSSEVKQLTNILLSGDYKVIESAYTKFLAKGQLSLLISTILTDITETKHFELEYETALVSLFVMIYDRQPSEAKDLIYDFVKRYRKQSDHFECPCHELLYIQVLEHLLRAYKQPSHYQLIYWLAHPYVDLIVSDNVATYYNLAGKLLTFMMKVLAKQPNFDYDPEFTATLIDFVEPIVKKRKLKTLGKTLERAQKIF